MSNTRTDDAELAAVAEELGSETAEMVAGELNPNAIDAPFVIKLRHPVEHDGTKFEELHFDFESLTGQDSRDVLNMLNRKGHAVLMQTVDEEFMRAMAVRACTDRTPDGRMLSADIFDRMVVRDVNRVLSRLRRFL